MRGAWGPVVDHVDHWVINCFNQLAADLQYALYSASCIRQSPLTLMLAPTGRYVGEGQKEGCSVM
jgi:hypothetical protein